MDLYHCNPNLTGFVDPFAQPQWDVVDRTPLRNIVNEPIGGDIHTTVDINPNSPSFGEPHDTLQMPGGNKLHFP